MGCCNKHLAKGLCRTHYLRQYKHGRLTLVVQRGIPTVDKILLKCVRAGNGCLIYTGKLTRKGYAHVRDGARMRFAHVVMYEAQNGPITVGLEIDHKCRNRACCEHSHLEPVTHAENVRRGLAGHDWRTKSRSSAGQFTKAQKEKGFI